jgi:hypothetical protein
LTPVDFQIPPDLLQAVSAEDGGRIVIVIGAGASLEPPTRIPLASECSEQANRALIADNVLAEGDCLKPEDLSELAEVVLEKTLGQKDLVERLPCKKFRMAQPNEGSMLAAAMLREGAVSTVLSLNFDLSVQQGLAQLGGTDVAVIRGPEDHGQLAAFNFIFLHRSVEADPEKWILTTKDLEEGWKETWVEVIAARVVASAVTVFAGLGDPAGVLVETTRRIKQAVPDAANTYQVDPQEHADSEFAAGLAIKEADYIKTGWCSFMRALAARLMKMHADQIREDCKQLIESEGWDDEIPDHLTEALMQLALIGVGRMRARWLIDPEAYLPHRGSPHNLIADLLLGIALVERQTGASARLADDGVVDFIRDGLPIGSLAIRSGRGTTRWSTLESKMHEERIRVRVTERRPRVALVNAIPDGRPPDVVPPGEVIGERSDGRESIIDRGDDLVMLSIDELREDPSRIDGWLN